MAVSMDRPERPLGDLLDAVERGNKRDAVDYTNGHLNEANLYRAPEFHSHKPWQSSKAAPIQHRKPKVREPREKTRSDRNKMVSALTDFAVGEESFLPSVKNKRKPSKPKDSLSRPTSNDNDWGQSLRGTVHEQALVEELDSHQLMLRRGQKDKMSWAHEDTDNDGRTSDLRHAFYNMKTGATKKDQYMDMKSFESKVIRKKETLEREVLSGRNAVIHLEKKLDRVSINYVGGLISTLMDGSRSHSLSVSLKELKKLGNSRSTRFHRLQAHSEILEELIDSSPIFGSVLRQIKTGYDNYVSWLLDNHPTQSHTLRQQVDDLYQKGVSNPKQLKGEQEKLAKLEKEGRKLLEINDKLRAQLGEERITNAKEIQAHSQELAQREKAARDERQPTDLADQLQDLHTTINSKMDELEEMRKRLREEYVPTSVIHNLEQCLKDTEIEVQKLLKQNEIFETSVEEMQAEITQILAECDASDTDKQKVLEKLNSLRLPERKQPFHSYEEYSMFLEKGPADLKTNLFDPITQGESSEEEDAAQTGKWNWYIS